MADDQDTALDQAGNEYGTMLLPWREQGPVVAVPLPWHPDGVMGGLQELNAAAGQSSLGAVMSPEQTADVDWGDTDPPVLNRADGGQVPWTVNGQSPGLTPPATAPAGPTAADQVDPDQPTVVAQPPVPPLPPKYLVDQISKSEGTGDTNGRSGYDMIYGYGQTSKPLSQMTLPEVRQQQNQMDGPTPVGRYQINKGTLGDLQNKLGLGDDTVFNPAVQDQMAQQLMADRGKWNDFIDGKISAAQFGQNLSGTWSSLKKPDNMAQFQSVLSQVRRNK